MDIIQVTTPAQIKAFHSLPFRIYKGHPGWVSHLRQDVEKIFDSKKNRLFDTGCAERWLLIENGETVGRVAAFVSQKYSKGMEQPTGGMGFFECIDNQKAAHQLMQTAQDWLAEQNVEAIDGPINFGEKDKFWGLLVENFESLTSYGMNFNPAYYVKFFTSFGFELYYNQIVYHREMVPAQEMFHKKAMRVNVPNFRVDNVRKMSVSEIGEAFRTVYNNAWGGHHGFKKMGASQGQKLARALKPAMDPDVVVFAWAGDVPIGFYVSIPELNQIFDKVNGNLNFKGKMLFLWHKWRKTPTTLVGLVYGVDRAYHGQGIESALIKYAEDFIVPLGRYNDTIMTWIGDFNPKMMKVAENLGSTPYRKLQTLRKMIDPTKKVVRMPMAE